MKVLIINQPVGNRGDESAHRAFIRQLVIDYPCDAITIVFFGEAKESSAPIQVEAPNIKYEFIPFKKGKIRLARFAISHQCVNLLVNIIPAYHKVDKLIKQADKVICAPGGICLGKFMNWDHLIWLKRAQHYKKQLAYYSRSFGPFEGGDHYKELFNKESISVLKYMDFMSIRDKKSMDLADSLGLKYIPSIDTAFLENPVADLSSLKNVLTNNYVVFVPNSLIWQPAFSHADANEINSFYCAVINLINTRFNDCKIIMMPQLFGQGTKNDVIYFQKIKELSNANNIEVLPDIYSSDIQQNIIKGSKLVIGARYHSIVFAINNERPFVSLSYEHKMFGLLSILGLDERQVDITQIGTQSFSKDNALQSINKIIDRNVDMSVYHQNARKTALNCYNIFAQWLR